MLRKKFKKVMSIILATATIMTVFAPTTVSAASPKPKYKHSKAEIAKRVDYMKYATDTFAFVPNGEMDNPKMTKWTNGKNGTSCFPVYNQSASLGKTGANYDSYQMCRILANTPGITSADKKAMLDCAKVWQKAIMSTRMINFYKDVWNYDFEYVSSASATVKNAKTCYTRVVNYNKKYRSYNPVLADRLVYFSKLKYKYASELKQYYETKISTTIKKKYDNYMNKRPGAKVKNDFGLACSSSYGITLKNAGISKSEWTPYAKGLTAIDKKYKIDFSAADLPAYVDDMSCGWAARNIGSSGMFEDCGQEDMPLNDFKKNVRWEKW